MVSATTYVPERGDIVWIDLNPKAGHEQAGRRPAVVLTSAEYNQQTNLAVLCPITSKVKGYRFEVSIPDGLKVSGVILADQVKSQDWRARNAEFADQLQEETLDELVGVVEKVIRGAK